MRLPWRVKSCEPIKMKVFVFTWDRYESLTTPTFLEKEKIPHIILCHSEEQKEKFIKAGRVNPNNIIATKNPKGLTYNRNFALDMMKSGEWAIFFVDDLVRITELDNYDSYKGTSLPITIKNSSGWNIRFKKEILIQRFIERAEESIRFAERFGICLVGFAGFENPLFLTEKWKFNSLADGRAWCVKKTSLRFDENVQMVDDVNWTALNIKYSGVLINQWVIPNFRRYTKGGFGSILQRLEQRRLECKYLVNTYPNLIKYAKKTGWPFGTHVRIIPQACRFLYRNQAFGDYMTMRKLKID